MSEGTTATATGSYVLRFGRVDRTLHGFLMLSFLGLAFTGLPVLFNDAGWAPTLAKVFGGFAAAHALHRVFAAIMIGVFLIHVGRLVLRLVRDKDYAIFWGPNSMVPQPSDLQQMFQQFRWFFGKG